MPALLKTPRNSKHRGGGKSQPRKHFLSEVMSRDDGLRRGFIVSNTVNQQSPNANRREEKATNNPARIQPKASNKVTGTSKLSQ